MQHTTIEDWLSTLASAAPAPGGGAVAAMQTAMAAGLVEMVANLTIGKPRYAEHEQLMTETLAEAGRLRGASLVLVEEDARAFTAVTDAYQLPKVTETDQEERTARIQDALRSAAEVPARTAQVAARLIELAEQMLPGANVNVLSDVAVAAASARAALDACVVNIEINRDAITDTEERAVLTSTVRRVAAHVAQAEAVLADVRSRIDS